MVGGRHGFEVEECERILAAGEIALYRCMGLELVCGYFGRFHLLSLGWLLYSELFHLGEGPG